MFAPEPCFGCGTPVEAIVVDGAPVVLDERLQASRLDHLFAPPLCWECRGVIFLRLPQPPADAVGGVGMLLPGFAHPNWSPDLN